MKTVGVLALQGAVTEHIQMLTALGVNAVTVKKSADLNVIDGLIIPGGESTAISRLMSENQLIEPIKQFAKQGGVIFGTCAGLILCAKPATESTQQMVQPLNLIDIVVTRNGFGRQVDSFEVPLNIKSIGDNISAVFIRAPYIESVGEHVDILATVENRIVMAQQDNILVSAFHPELTSDHRVMAYFISLIKH